MSYAPGVEDPTTQPVELACTRSGTGPPVLLLHGQGARGADFGDQSEALVRSYEVIAVDLRGHGASPVTPGPYRMSMLAADVVALCRRLELESVHVVGHSLGGCVGLAMALEHPTHVRTLTVINALARMAPTGVLARVQAALLRASLRLVGVGPVARASAKMHFPEATQSALRERLIERMTSTPLVGYRAAQAAVENFDVTERLAEITCPVLMVAGDGDPLPLEDKRALANDVQNGRLVVLEDSRHVSIWDQPDALNALLLDFLAEAHPSDITPDP